jgi:phenylacetate-CoA ligase
MNHVLEENFILPLSDLLTGQSVNKSFRFLMKSQYWSREQIDYFQNKRLRKLIVQAYDFVPYYHDLFIRLNIRPEDISSKEDLSKIPILTKAIIKKEGIKRFTATNITNRNIIHSSSSGSTGEPLQFLTTKESYSMNIAANLRGWYGMGYRLGDKFVKLSQNTRDDKIKQLQDLVTNNLYLSTNPLTDAHLKEVLDQIEKYKPLFIRCYPDPLVLLANYRKSHSKEYTFSPKAIATTGNTLFPEMRIVIESAFGCKVFDSYSSEGNSCVFECNTHSCYHSSEEYGISEILDDGGNRISKGLGHLISTDLWNFVHPFIRYDTQDLVEVDDSSCICGNNHLRINRILGRDNEMLVTPSGRRFIVHNFTGYFEYVKEIEQFQVIRRRDGSILFRFVVNEGYSPQVEAQIITFWKAELQMPIVVEVVDRIPIMSNNKRRFIVNEL